MILPRNNTCSDGLDMECDFVYRINQNADKFSWFGKVQVSINTFE